MMLVNGKEQHCIAIADRGLQYGDGLFETVEIKKGHPYFLRQHLDRLQRDCQRLSIPFPNKQLLETEVFSLVKRSPQAVLKIILTRGVGGRGYRPPDTVQTTRILSLHPFPDYPEDYFNTGIHARFCETRLGHNPLLAGIKHLNRLEQVLARAEWDSPHIPEGLMLDHEDYVIEGTMTNLFLIKNNTVYTPLLDQCGVSGIIRKIVKKLAQAHQLIVKEIHINKEYIFSADELFVTNSIIGLWPIKQLNEHVYQSGMVTNSMKKWLTEYKEKDLKDG